MAPVRLLASNRNWPIPGQNTPVVNTNNDILPYSPPQWYLDGDWDVELQALPGINGRDWNGRGYWSYPNQKVVVRPPIDGSPFSVEFFGNGQKAIGSLVIIGGVMQMPPSLDDSGIQRVLFLSDNVAGSTVDDVYLEGIQFLNPHKRLGDAVQVLGGISGTFTMQNCYIEGIRYTTAIHGDGVQLHGGYVTANFAHNHIKSGGQGAIFRPDTGNSGITNFDKVLFERIDYDADDPGVGLTLYMVNDNSGSNGNPIAAAPESVTFNEVYLDATSIGSNVASSINHVNFTTSNDGNGDVDFSTHSQTFRTYSSATLAKRFFGKIYNVANKPQDWTWLAGNSQPGNNYVSPGYEEAPTGYGPTPAPDSGAGDRFMPQIIATSNNVATSQVMVSGVPTRWTLEQEPEFGDKDMTIPISRPAAVRQAAAGETVPGAGQKYAPNSGFYTFELGSQEWTYTNLPNRRAEVSLDSANNGGWGPVLGETTSDDVAFRLRDDFILPSRNPSWFDVKQYRQTSGGSPPLALGLRRLTGGTIALFVFNEAATGDVLSGRVVQGTGSGASGPQIAVLTPGEWFRISQETYWAYDSTGWTRIMINDVVVDLGGTGGRLDGATMYGWTNTTPTAASQYCQLKMAIYHETADVYQTDTPSISTSVIRVADTMARARNRGDLYNA
jgi:hypothetical protein